MTQSEMVKKYCCPECKWKLKCLTTNHPVDSDWNEIAHECQELWANERNSGTLWRDILSPESYKKLKTFVRTHKKMLARKKNNVRNIN